MRESLVRVLLDLEICLVKLDNTSQAYEKTPITMEEALGVTFLNTNLLLGTIINNNPLYILANFDRFMVARMLVNLDISANMMSLTTIIYLLIEISKLEANGMMLKEFNECRERALRSITFTFKLDGWVLEVKSHIIDKHTSFNVLLRRIWIHENKVVSSSLH